MRLTCGAQTERTVRVRREVLLAAEHPDIQLALCTGIIDAHTRQRHRGHGYAALPAAFMISYPS